MRLGYERAWELFAATMHPRLTVETSSQEMTNQYPHTPKPPIIILNGVQIKPSTPPAGASGYQVVILE